MLTKRGSQVCEYCWTRVAVVFNLMNKPDEVALRTVIHDGEKVFICNECRHERRNPDFTAKLICLDCVAVRRFLVWDLSFIHAPMPACVGCAQKRENNHHADT